MRRGENRLTVAFTALLCALTLTATQPAAAAKEPLKNFVRLAKPSPVGDLAFKDGDGHARSLADFRGKVVLLNIWATWCVPCRAEMPSLDRLHSALGSSEFEVVTVSIDRGGADAVRKFYQEVGIRHLAIYLDASGQILRDVRAVGLPTSLLIDREGQEIGRIVGPAEWDRPEVAEFLQSVIRNQGAPVAQADQASSQPPATSSGPPGLVARGLHWLGTLLGK